MDKKLYDKFFENMPDKFKKSWKRYKAKRIFFTISILSLLLIFIYIMFGSITESVSLVMFIVGLEYRRLIDFLSGKF